MLQNFCLPGRWIKEAGIEAEGIAFRTEQDLRRLDPDRSDNNVPMQIGRTRTFRTTDVPLRNFNSLNGSAARNMVKSLVAQRC
jgi:hypothetical protein